MRLLKLYLIPLVMLIGNGCASVIEGNDQTINVSVAGCEEYKGVTCTVTNDEGSSLLTPPASVSVEKDKDSLTVMCSSADGLARGQSAHESSYEAWNAGNILIGGIIGIGVDAATGAMWKYPDAIVVPMKCKKNSTSPIYPLQQS
jgi:hypothetical protein